MFKYWLESSPFIAGIVLVLCVLYLAGPAHKAIHDFEVDRVSENGKQSELLRDAELRRLGLMSQEATP